MVDKPTPLDLSDVEKINKTLDTVYGQLDWWRNYLGFDGNVPRIYYHGGDRIEELIARLRGEIMVIAKQITALGVEVEAIENKVNEILAYIDTALQEAVDASAERIGQEILEQIKTDLALVYQEKFSAPTAGIPMLDNIINRGYTMKDNDFMNVPFLSNVANVNTGNLQGVELDGTNMEWYVTQSDTIAAPDEGFVIMRLNASGEMISNMYLPKAGHGQNNWLQMSGGVAWWYFVQNANIYRVAYEDFTTKDHTAWEPILIQGPAPTNALHGFDYTTLREGHNAFVWRHVDNQTERDASVTPTATNEYTIYAQNAEHNEDGTWTFNGPVASLNIEQYVPNTHDNSMQGMAALNKADVTGVDDGKNVFYIFVSYGFWSVKSEILVLEYDQDAGTIVYKTIIKNMNHVVRRPQEKHIFELEGLSHVRYETGSNTAAGLIFSNAGGRSGSYMNRLFGFVNNPLLNLVSSFNREYTGDINRRYSDTTVQPNMWSYGPGSFVIRAAEWATLTDRPYRWRGDAILAAGYAYLDTIGKRDNSGDLIQTLTIPNYTGPVETYMRFVNFNFKHLGADWGPENITPWQPVGAYGARAKTPQSLNDTAVYLLTEQVPMYLAANREGFDYEGLPTTSAYTITSLPMGALVYPDETTFLQTAVVHNVSSNEVVTYTRYVRGVVAEFGSSLSTKTYASSWVKKSTSPSFTQLIGGLSWLQTSVREGNEMVSIEFTGQLPSDVDFTDTVNGGSIPAGYALPAGNMPSFGTLHNITSASTATPQSLVVSIIASPDGKITFNGNGVIPSGSYVYGSVHYMKDIQ